MIGFSSPPGVCWKWSYCHVLYFTNDCEQRGSSCPLCVPQCHWQPWPALQPQQEPSARELRSRLDSMIRIPFHRVAEDPGDQITTNWRLEIIETMRTSISVCFTFIRCEAHRKRKRTDKMGRRRKLWMQWCTLPRSYTWIDTHLLIYKSILA